MTGSELAGPLSVLGAGCWLSTTKVPFRDAEGNIVGILQILANLIRNAKQTLADGSGGARSARKMGGRLAVSSRSLGAAFTLEIPEHSASQG